MSTPAGILIWSLRSTSHLALAVAGLARRGHHLARAAALAAGPGHAEEALLEGHLSRAAAGRAGAWRLRARRGPAALAGGAALRARDLDLGLRAEGGLLEA